MLGSRTFVAAVALLASLSVRLSAQVVPDSSTLTLDRLFASDEFAARAPRRRALAPGPAAYTKLEADSAIPAAHARWSATMPRAGGARCGCPAGRMVPPATRCPSRWRTTRSPPTGSGS